MTVYQVKDWNENFEGAKSREYNNKSSCQMPTKHGLGYRKLIRCKNGPALFGAWCALIQVLSKQPKKRHGYLTDTGRADGNPYSPEDLEILTDIPASLFKQLLQVANGSGVNWLRIPEGYHDNPERIPQGGIDLDSDLDTDSDLPDKSGDKIALNLATQLLEAVGRAMGKKLVSTPKSSRKPIADLMKRGVTEKEILDVIAWLEHENPKRGEFALVIESGKSLFEKWDKLQVAMCRPKAGSAPRAPRNADKYPDFEQ